ncbi:MAG: helix-turn-helix transcriptional regulator [Actinomycetota bacterium]
MVAMFATLLRRDRERWGLRVARAAWLAGVSVSQYRELEAGERLPDFDTCQRISELYGWPQSYEGTDVMSRSGTPVRHAVHLGTLRAMRRKGRS